VVKGVFPKEEKVEQEVPRGPQAPSCEEVNLSFGARQAPVHIVPIELTMYLALL
jgi:hypothetical protein